MLFRSLVLLSLASCSDSRPIEGSLSVQSAPVQVAATTQSDLASPMVSALWVLTNQWEPDILILDARSPAAYAEGHIPGAVNLHYAETYDQRPDHERDVAQAQVLSEIFSSHGLSQDHTLVVYGDDNDYRPAARLFWVLEVHGHPSAGVLNGGLQAWSGVGGELSQEPVALPKGHFVASLDPSRYADRRTVLQAALDPATVLIDMRSQEDYSGSHQPARFDRWGHIPGAIHRDARQLSSLSKDLSCTLLSPEALAPWAGSLPDEKVILYCNSGRSASVGYLALRSRGKNVAVYDGSWADWSAQAELPIETGMPALGR